MSIRSLLSTYIVVLAAVPLLAQMSYDPDFDGSGEVDFSDFVMFARAFGTTDPQYDLDNSGTVDFPDFVLFARAFGSPAEPAVTPITELTEVVVYDLPADPDRQDVFTFYSLRDSAIVAQADSNSTKWDLAFKSTTVLINGGSSGPGEGGATVLTETDYDALTMAPDSEYAVDREGQPAIGREWYTYTGPPNHYILINPGVVLVVRTADGRYAKLKFTSYYMGGEAVPSSPDARGRFLNFTYTFQPDGSRSFAGPPKEIETLTAVMVRDVPADTGNVGAFTFYSLRDSAIVAHADSNSTKWDLAFKSTTVLTNSGASGPGAGGAIVLTATDYDTLSMAPDSEYVIDQEGQPAISRAWYTYTGPPSHQILINPGVVLVIRTADERYAKLKFTSYYQGGEAVPSSLDSRSRFYHFTYTFQPDGSRSFR